MFSTIKMYLVAGIAFAISVLSAVFIYRGNKIDSLEKDLEIKDKESKVAAKVVETEKAVAEFVADNRVARAIAEKEDNEDLNKYDPSSKFFI